MNPADLTYMEEAFQEALKAYNNNEVPIGAILVDNNNGEIIARSGNATIELSDPTAHAEINVIRQGCTHFKAQRIPECNLYVTLEPCTMCAAAISFARINRLVFGAYDNKGGAVVNGVRFFEQSTCHHKIDYLGGVLEEECSELLKKFFIERR
jgi:tRNA(Arg) A34 adenosine deaminase TadA